MPKKIVNKKISTAKQKSVSPLLFMDTSDFKALRFALIWSDLGQQAFFKEKRIAIAYNQSEKTLEFLIKFLKSKPHSSSLDDIQAIYTVSGPGSFTGIRVGVAMAMAFGLALEIPVYFLKQEQVPSSLLDLPKLRLKPHIKKPKLNYGAEPNITAS